MSQWGHCEEFHTEWNQLLGQIICISVFASRGWAQAYQEAFLSLCLFFTNEGFSWKTGHYACVSLDHAFGGISPHQGGLKLSELDKWAKEWSQLTVPGWPHTVLAGQKWLTGSQGLRWVILERQNGEHQPTKPSPPLSNLSARAPVTDNTRTKKEVKAS